MIEMSLGCENGTIEYSKLKKNIALWPLKISNELQEYFVMNPPDQNMDKIKNARQFFNGKKPKWLSLRISHFFFTDKNKNKFKREWLVYSEKSKKLYCYVCKLFICEDDKLCKDGFDDWRHASQRITGHERSIDHRKSVCILSNRTMKKNCIDQDIVLQHKKEAEYWRNVLKRIVAAIKFISQRGLPFFGDDEKLNSPHNGMFLGILEDINKSTDK